MIADTDTVMLNIDMLHMNICIESTKTLVTCQCMKDTNDEYTLLPFAFAPARLMPFGGPLYQAMPGSISKRPPLVCKASTTGIVAVARIIQGEPSMSRSVNCVVLKKPPNDRISTLKDEGAILTPSSICRY